MIFMLVSLGRLIQVLRLQRHLNELRRTIHRFLFEFKKSTKCSLSDRRRVVANGCLLGKLFILSFCYREFNLFSFILIFLNLVS
jgi:hypothetical protein